MPDIPSLLARAAELAPEWCTISDSGFFVLQGIKGDGWLYKPIDDEYRAILLYAVLKECERRGLAVTLNLVISSGRSWWRVSGPRILRSVPWASDPATAALAAFVAMLEQAKEVTT